MPIWAQGFIKSAPELSRNKLNISYGINFKYNGKVHHNVDRVWVVTKIDIPKTNSLKFPVIGLDSSCAHFTTHGMSGAKREFPELEFLCQISQPYIQLLKEKESYYKSRASDIIQKDVYYALHGNSARLRRYIRGPTQNFSQPSQSPVRRKRFGAFIPVIAGLATIAVEALGSFLQKKRNGAIKQGIHAIQNDQGLLANAIKSLDKDLLLYGKFSLENFGTVSSQMAEMSDRLSSLENFLNGDSHPDKKKILFSEHSDSGHLRYSHMLQTYFNTVSDRHIKMYEELVAQLTGLLRAIRTLNRGYIPIELFPPSLLRNITQQALLMVRKQHPDYVSVIARATSYYDMKLVTFGLDNQDNLVVAFPIFIQDHTRSSLRLYEMETVKVPIADENLLANSYTELTLPKPYIAINRDYYIDMKIQELRMCKKIRDSFLCEELFLVKHRTKSSCASAIYYNSPPNVVNSVCTFKYFYNTTVVPSVLDGGNQVLLANMLSTKKLVCEQHHEIATPIPSNDYVLVNRSILCSCHLDMDFMYLLRSISACTANPHSLVFHFSTNLPFMQILKDFMNTTGLNMSAFLSLTPVVLPIKLNNTLLPVKTVTNSTTTGVLYTNPTTLTELRKAMARRQATPVLPQNHFSFVPGNGLQYDKKKPNKNDSVVEHTLSHWFYMISCILSTAFTLPLLYLALKHKKLRAWVSAMAVYRAPQINALTMDNLSSENTAVCTDPWLSLVATIITLIGAAIFIIKYIKPLKWIHGFEYPRVCHVYLFISTDCRYVPVRVTSCKGMLYFFSFKGTFEKSNITLKKNYLWDTIHIDWKDSSIMYNNKPLPVVQDITVPMLDKIRLRNLIKKKDAKIYIMTKQGTTWCPLTNKDKHAKTRLERLEEQIIESTHVNDFV